MSNANPLVVIDTETSGLGKQAQIIELAIQRGLSGAAEVWRIKPTVPIEPSASAIHGIQDADLIDCPGFEHVADEIRAIVESASVIVAFNAPFDLGIIDRELVRVGQAPLNLAHVKLVDPLQLWRKLEPRTLAAAHERFVGGAIDGAHSAAGDVAATGRVLLGLLDAFGVEPDWDVIAGLCAKPSRPALLADDVFTSGKHQGANLADVVTKDRDYVLWLATNDKLPAEVRDACALALTVIDV